eukprot:93799-Amphidinium_carterae.1
MASSVSWGDDETAATILAALWLRAHKRKQHQSKSRPYYAAIAPKFTMRLPAPAHAATGTT